MPQISVILPSLNVSQYIGTCIESVFSQGIKDIEVLAVDAGSTDGTKEILERYAHKHSNMKFIQSDVRSYGHQMNLGLNAAIGDYIFFLETDDLLKDGALQQLLSVAVDNPTLDFVKGYAEGFFDLFQGGVYDIDLSPYGAPKDLRGQIICPADMPSLLYDDIFHWLGLYRREFLKNIRFNETAGAAFQDQGFLLQTLSKSKEAMYVDIPVYRYRQNNPGSSIYQPKGFGNILQEYRLNEHYLSGLSNDWKQVFYRRMLEQTLTRYRMMALSGRFWKDVQHVIEEIRLYLCQAEAKGLLSVDIFNDGQRIFWHALKEDTFKPFEDLSKKYSNTMDKLWSIVSWVRNREVVIYGAGNWGKYIQAFLLIQHVGDVRCFADQSKDLQGTKVQGTVVLSPEDALRDYHEAHYLIANARYSDEIFSYLIQAGIPENHIIAPKIIVDYMMFLADFNTGSDKL